MGPVTEEFCFRACMLPLLLLQVTNSLHEPLHPHAVSWKTYTSVCTFMKPAALATCNLRDPASTNRDF